MAEKEKVVVIIGPTAVGKTSLSIELAKKWNGEIISGDSMQIYKGMDIATAKVKSDEMDGIVHHLIDIIEPEDSFSVAAFQQLVRKKISEITKRGKLPIIVGGTGLYIQAVLYDYQFQEKTEDPSYRLELEKRGESEGTEALHKELEKVDPEAAEKIHHHNVRRVIRALEIFHLTGKKMSETNTDQQNELLYDAAIVGLTMDRELLYDRINKRVDDMLKAGLLDEVSFFYDQGIRNCQSIQAIGYKEIYKYLDGLLTLEQAVEELKQNSRRYAKRQFTWFRNKISVQWFDMTDSVRNNDIAKKTIEISTYLEGKLQLK